MQSYIINKKSGQLVMLLFCVAGLFSCEKLVDIDPPITAINQENVFRSDASAAGALTGIYAQLSDIGQSAGFTGYTSISLFAGLQADELTLFHDVNDNTLNAWYKNAMVSAPGTNLGSENWDKFYKYIFQCNAAIEGLTASTFLTPSVKQQLLGEARFMRAFFYFYQVNIFDNIPLVLTTDPTITASLPQSSKQDVYKQIIADLKEAQSLMSADYLNGGIRPYTGVVERARPNKWVATALLARAYLFAGEYANAEQEASTVIGHTTLFSLQPLNDAFLRASKEVIWSLQPVRTARNTEDAYLFILPATGPTPIPLLSPVYLSPQLLDAFEDDDRRLIDWVDSVVVLSTTYYYPHKYKATAAVSAVTEHLVIFRLAEQFLIRAEARAQQNKIGLAQADLDAIRTRAGLSGTTAATKEDLLDAILHERQVELFTEHGHRWYDLKRTGKVNSVMATVTSLKGGTWSNFKASNPLPWDDLQRNRKLIQNTGY